MFSPYFNIILEEYPNFQPILSLQIAAVHLVFSLFIIFRSFIPGLFIVLFNKESFDFDFEEKNK